MLFQQSVNGVAQLTNSLSVNDPQLVYSAGCALVDEVEHNILYVLRPEGVQIKNPIDGQLNWLIIFWAHACSVLIRETPYRFSSDSPIPPIKELPYKCSYKEVIDNIAFSDQERFSSESRSWLLGPCFFPFGLNFLPHGS